MAKTLVYQMYPLAWKGFREMIDHLPQVADLRADYVWLSPIFPSPFQDGGYDVADYTAVNPAFGTMEDLDEFIARAHDLGIGVLLDLVLNHTSVKHRWFREHPEYYYWRRSPDGENPPYPGWHNLFNGGGAWAYDDQMDSYYLHLFHQDQADLKWFSGNRLNKTLVKEFQRIVHFWDAEHGVDGFRLDVPQSINKDFQKDTLAFSDLLVGSQSVEVINAVFKGREELYLIMECFDPTMGDLVQYYSDNTQVDFVLNVMLKEQISQGKTKFLQLIDQSTHNPRFMLDLESHDSPRFPSREGVTPEDAIQYLFGSEAQGICLYQGQELGMENPNKRRLPDELMLKLDAQTAMRYIKGEELDDLRPASRANARIPLPMGQYRAQQRNPDSYLNLTKKWIVRWRTS